MGGGIGETDTESLACRTNTIRNMMQTMQQQPSVAYYALTEEQLEQYAKEVARNVLCEFGVSFDEQKARFTPDTKDEYQPIDYWLRKMNVNRSTLWRWAKDGKITPRHVGKKVYYCQRDFDELFMREKGGE